MDDTISRRAAIDAVKEELDNGTFYDIPSKIEYLPSAQPEPIKINIEDFNKEDWERFRKEWGNTPITVLSAQPEIIHCMDCDWWTKQEDSLQGRCALMGAYPTGWWFCGNARRRTDG